MGSCSFSWLLMNRLGEGVYFIIMGVMVMLFIVVLVFLSGMGLFGVGIVKWLFMFR